MRKHGWRTPEWKLIHALEPDFHFKPEVELYNLVQDPEENTNLAEQEPELHLRPHHGRGTSPALAARIRRLPAITIGALDEHGLPPHSHQMSDTADPIDESPLDRAVEAALLLVDKIDADLGRAGAPPVAAAS